MNCTNWRPRRTRSTERVVRAVAAAVAITLACVSSYAAASEPSRFEFAVIGNVFASRSTNDGALQKMIDAISVDPHVSFVVYDGNLRNPDEPCSDALYERREALLGSSRPALIFVPGEHDWVTCAMTHSGRYDPAERLDQLRQTIFSDPSSLGQNPLPLTRESEIPRFRPYHENVRWQVGNTVFVALNLPDGNNHFLYAGGRNGEFEDRVIANAFWLEHAAEYAKRRNARAIVIFVQGNPWGAERRERAERFRWLRFGHRPRDGYIEFRQSLAKLAQTFRGPVLIVHEDDLRLARGFEIDQPLRNEKGATMTNVTRVAVALHNPAAQWLHVDVDTGRRPPVRIAVRDVPKHLPPLPPPQQPALPLDGGSPALPDMPAISSMPDVTEIPAMPPYVPPTPPVTQPLPQVQQRQTARRPPAPLPTPQSAPPGAGAVYRN